jgi:replicative DNA helicase
LTPTSSIFRWKTEEAERGWDKPMTEFLPPEETVSTTTGVPHSREAEEAVIGAVLINPEVYYDLAQFLQPEDFYIHRLRWVWEAFMRLHERRTPIDMLTVSEDLERQGQLAEVGGAAFLTALLNQVPTTLHAEAYGRMVENASIRRKMLTAANQIATLAYDEAEEVNTVMGEAEKAVFNVSERKLRHDVRPIRAVMSELYDRMGELAAREDEIFGVPTGFIDLDRMLGGLQPSDLLIIAGRPGQGKTAMLLTIAHNAALVHKKRVAVFSLEMSNEQVAQRLIAQETAIDSHRLRTGKLSDDDWPLFTHAIEVLSDTRIFLDDTPALSPLQLRTKCRRLHMEFGIDLIIVDYLQLMASDSRTENRVQEVSYISRSLKALARELNVPLLAAAQLSRAVEQRADKEPQLSDLRESGCLTGDTLVAIAESGQVTPISALEGKENFNVWALNPQTYKLECRPVSHAFTTGIKPVFKLTTRLGRTIRATANHRFLTINGWRRLDELMADDFIALPRLLAGPSEQTMTGAELALLGHLLGDGCTLPNHAIQYTTHEHDLAESVAKLAIEVFGGEVDPRTHRERRWYQVYLASTRHHTHNIHSAVTDWLNSLEVFGLRSYEKFVPTKVFEQPTREVAIFLRHLWATDGSIQLIKGKKIRPIAYYASSSPRMARDVQALLLRIGINGALRQVPQNGKGRDQFNVIITGKSDLERFASVIGAVGVYKQKQLEEVCTHLREHAANTNRDVIPNQIWRAYVVPSMRKKGMTTRQLHAAIDTAYCGTGLYKQNVSRERAARVAKIVQSTELSALAQSDVYWDSIASILPDGEEQVFDLTVPGHQNFVANNIIVHNSLEQDADIVMFIHRPDDKDPAMQNVTHLKIAKHRNGPVGTVDLIFRSNLTKFENAATRRVDLNE